jgi:hypothetical protein
MGKRRYLGGGLRGERQLPLPIRFVAELTSGDPIPPTNVAIDVFPGH